MTARGRWIAVFLVLLGFGLRVHNLALNELYEDEEFSYIVVNQTPADVVNYNRGLAEPHPVLSYYIQQFSYTFGGNNEIAVRMPSAWFGTLALALAWQLARALRRGLPRGAPALTTGLLAIQSLAVKSSREMRMYSMSMALSLAGSVAMLRMLRRPGRASWLVYVLVSAAALQVHYYTAFVLVAHNAVAAWMLLSRRLEHPRRSVTWWVAAQLTIGLITLPWLIFVRDVLLQYPGNESRTSLAAAPLQVAGWLTIGTFQPGFFYPVAWLVVGVLAIGALRMARTGPHAIHAGATLWLLLGVPLALTALVAQNRNIWAERYVNNAAPYILALLAAAVLPYGAWRAQRMRPAAAAPAVAPAAVLVACLAFGQFGYATKGLAPEAFVRRKFVQMVDNYTRTRPLAQIRVASNYPEASLGMYYLRGPQLVTIPYRANDLQSARDVVREMLAAGVRRVIFRQVDDRWDSQRVADPALREGFHLIREDFTGRWILKIFGHAEPGDLKPVGASFANGIRIEAADVLGDPAARMAELYLTWSAATPRTGNEKVFMHVTEAGNPAALVAQEDYPLGDADLSGAVRSYGFKFWDDAVLHPGTYVIRVGLYDPSKPGAPRIPLTDGRDAYILGEFDVK